MLRRGDGGDVIISFQNIQTESIDGFRSYWDP